MRKKSLRTETGTTECTCIVYCFKLLFVVYKIFFGAQECVGHSIACVAHKIYVLLQYDVAYGGLGRNVRIRTHSATLHTYD